MADERPIVEVVGETVVVRGSDEFRADRTVRIYFDSVLAAQRTPDGWACRRRRDPVGRLAVQVYEFLRAKQWNPATAGAVDEYVARELERRRSFERARVAGETLREKGTPAVDAGAVAEALRRFGWSFDARDLRPHQVLGVQHALTTANAANFSVPGSGKTATTLAVAATHLESGTVELVVVVGPLASFRPWELETVAALPGKLRCRRVRGTKSQRSSAYASASPGQLLLTSYATAASDRAQLKDLLQRFRTMLVVDEAHRIKRFRGGTWAPALIELASFARVRVVLTGTPMPQNGRDLFSPLNVLWPGGELTGKRDDFAARVDRDFGSVVRTVQPFVSRAPKEALGLRPYEVVPHEVPLSGTQREVYLLVEGRFRRLLEDADSWREKLDTLKRARPIRLLQAAANPGLLNRRDAFYRLPKIEAPGQSLMERLAAYEATDVPAKSELALELTRELVAAEQKVVVWSNFVANLDAFATLVRTRLGIPVYQVDGRVPAGDETVDDGELLRSNPLDEDTRERVIERFLAPDGPSVLVTNPASCSESISLHTACRTAIYLDRTYDCALYLQSVDRIHRLGLPPDAEVRVHLLSATVDGRPTIAGLVEAALRQKEGTMRRLLEGAELIPAQLQEDPLAAAEGTDEDLGTLLRFLLGEDASDK